jgi:hypothetical protein
MQVMLDMIMDLMNRIAREAANVFELEDRRTLTSTGIITASILITRDGKDAWCGSTMLEMNFVRYASCKYTNYKEYEYWEREAVPRAAAEAPPPSETEVRCHADEAPRAAFGGEYSAPADYKSFEIKLPVSPSP